MLPVPEPALEGSPREGGDLASPLTQDQFHTLVRLYFALAYGTDRDLHPLERQAITAIVRRWKPSATAHDAQGIVDAAFAAARSATSESPEALAETLAPALTPALRRRALADLGRVAKADGWLSLREASLIARVRQVWEEQASPAHGDGDGAAGEGPA